MSGPAEPTLMELIEAGVTSKLVDVHVSMPGTIISYDPATQTAKVQPGIKRVLFDDDDQRVEETIQPFENVPVMFFRCALFSMHANLSPGDTGDIIFGSESMAEWRQSGGTVTPGDLKRLHLTAPKFYPGLFAKNAPGPDTDESIGTPGGLRLHWGDGAIAVGDGSDAVAMNAKVSALFAGIKAAGAAGSGASPVDPGAIAFFTALAAALATIDVASTNLKAD